MAKVPGSAGLPLVGDKSYDFYKDPIRFLEKNMEQTKSRVFLTRFLNKPTVFVGSNRMLKETLTEGVPYMDLGYKAFMGEIYGDNILFTDGENAQKLRESLHQLFRDDSMTAYQETIDRVVKKSLDNLETRQPTCIYTFFKKLAMELCLSLFLGLDFDQASDSADVISELTITHWHGIISVPISLKLPAFSESTYSQALEAKRKLLAVIEKRREEKCYCFPQKVESLPNAHDVFINNHLLLFTSALVPKALSSILTSFALEIGKPEMVPLQDKLLDDTDLYDSVILEILRLYPPFIGGRRLVRKDCVLDGYKIPAGHAIIYMTYAAHRDPTIFESPDEFRPGRWQSSNKNDRNKLFNFGAGPRDCLGKTFVHRIIKSVLTELLSKHRFTLVEGQDLTHKWLPVSRPKGSILVHFEHK